MRRIGIHESIAFSTLAANATATITIVANVNCPTSDNTDIVDVAEVHPAAADPQDDEAENDSVTVNVLNPAPRVVNLATNPSSLWSPNHKMANVALTYQIEDNCGPITIHITVASNEPVNGTGDGDTAPDWEVISDHLLRLRSERAGTGTGRVYTITVTAADSAGQSGSASVQVTVPHDQK